MVWSGAPRAALRSFAFDENVMLALNVIDPILRVPLDFAWVLDAAGAVVLVHTGRIGMARAVGEEGAP